MKVCVPPIKSQGIKTKLVTFIAESICWDGSGTWVEPFMGSGVVGLNIGAERAIFADANPHLIEVYQDIQSGALTPASISDHLRAEGDILRQKGASHYYELRERFNLKPSSHDFLFLNRACFNGIIRFNRKGKFNVPFCKKEDRFRQAYVTKIANQVGWVKDRLSRMQAEFVHQDWKATLASVRPEDFVYFDPPYNARHADYYNLWTEVDDKELATAIKALKCGFALSTWLENQYRRNSYIDLWFADYPVLTREHFYHVGSTESLRSAMTEALVIQVGFDAGRAKKSVKTRFSSDLFSDLETP